MSNKTSENVANVKDDVMSQEAFNEIIDNFEVVATLTMYGRKSIKHYVKEMRAEVKQKDKRIQELEEENYVQKIQIYENSIPKQKVKEIFNKLNISDIEPWSIYKVSGEILFELQELLEGENNEL